MMLQSMVSKEEWHFIDLYLADELILWGGILAAIVADVVDIAVGLQGVDHLVHWLLEAVGLLVVVTILYAIGVVVKSIVVA